MSLLIGSGGGSVEEEIVAPIQGQAGSLHQLKSNTVLLRDLSIVTDTVGSTITTSGQTGYLRYVLIGDELFVTIDTYSAITVVAATCTAVKVRLPDGFVARTILPLSGHNDRRAAIANAKIITGGATGAGYLTLVDDYLVIERDASAAFATGSLNVYGQVHGPVAQRGQL